MTRFVYLASSKQVQSELKVSIQRENGLYPRNKLYTGTIMLIAHTGVHADAIAYHIYRDFRSSLYVSCHENFEFHVYLSRRLCSILDSAW